MKKGLTPVVQCDLNDVNVTQYNCLKELIRQISNEYRIQKSELEFFNSTESLIDSFFMNVVSQKIATCYIYSPIFQKYTNSAGRFCKRVQHINRFDSLDFSIEKNSLVIFTNPCKPDGQYYDLQELFVYWKKQECTILIDEAFLEYCTAKSFSAFINEYDKLYVIKSMQRFYNMKGLQITSLLSNKNNIKKIKKHEAKYKLSVLDTQYVLHVLKDKNFKKIHQAVNAKNMTLLQEVLKCTGLFETIYPSSTNMLLCQLKDMKAKEFIKLFKNESNDIKHCDSFMFLDEYHVRFTIHSEDEIKNLVDSFQIVYKK